jgi:3D (Asp-Asp-Asp) domain-containing protein
MYAPSTRAHRKPLGRVLAVCSLASCGIVGLQTASHAAAPDHFTVSRTDTFVDPDTCAASGFAVNVMQELTFYWIVRTGSSGNLVSAIDHVRATTTLSANGKTVTDVDHFQALIAADGSFREVGSVVHVMGPDGLVVRDSGQILHDAEGNVIGVKGPHPFLLGTGSYCSALAP